ncbi:Uma2 family endonuclease [Ornithinimicrobium faecis]|uniref:Uma2 family endonuclease n=1 Tax=Ornithinimicrobium faecis TaxID=2934158 RepID=A0ABY4YQH0_9MICO|nr:MULTISPECIES: Uma2 family endonuclease [unclassified Ornithinimicrobium]USQ78750.1 Uma2 family endonuclease [Ornithinimicrobium sp. HY1793]
MSMPTLTDRAHEHRVSRAEFEALREEREKRADGARYELLDGEVVVTPSPGGNHQLVVTQLVILMSAVLPVDWEVVTAPLDVEMQGGEGDTVLQPDVLITERSHLTDGGLHVAPLLAIEVLSPSTWRRDLGPKRDAYAAAGIRHYWVVAPKAPSVTVYRLGADGAFREEAHVTGDQQWTTDAPVNVALCPAELVR